MTEPPLERRLSESRAETKALAAQNATLTHTLKDARGQLLAMRAQLDRMGQPPLTRGRVIAVVDEFVDIFVLGRVLRVVAAADVTVAQLAPGDLVLLNEGLVITGHPPSEDISGEVARVVEAQDGLAIVAAGQDEVRVRLVGSALSASAGDTVRIERGAGLAVAMVTRQQVEELVLTEIPDVSYDDIGGLAAQIGQIRDAVELPFLHRERFANYRLTPPKGVLLYGPPGCGKTMIAKAVARSLGEQLLTGTDRDADPDAPGSIFINVKGPELLNKYVGESERQVRLIFERARQHATSGRPVIVFFDEMDSLFRTRGSGISSDVESTVVPQLLSEIDGVVGLDNVIVIGASNREDMIDPAILRAGRLDVKIKLDRPDAEAARDILAKYLVAEVPLADEGVESLIEAVVDDIYARDHHNRFLEVTYVSGSSQVLYFSDFSSGAMLRNIVDRAKRFAIKDELAGGAGGVSRAGLLQAARDEFRENEDLPNTTNPDDWARISGRRGERISWVRSLISH